MRNTAIHLISCTLIVLHGSGPLSAQTRDTGKTDLPYAVVDTGQVKSYSNSKQIASPRDGEAFFGQDASYTGSQPAYRSNSDGTVTDLNTGLMWQADPGPKVTYAKAVAGAAACRTGGYQDWRLPSVKELYSLIRFSGLDLGPGTTADLKSHPFIDTQYFNFQYGKESDGDRTIDSQYATSSVYVGTVMNGRQAMFGVNFADGRIKGYPTGTMPGRGAKKFCVLYVRGNPAYGSNDFVDNNDGSVTDRATGLQWMKVDSGYFKAGKNGDGTMNWQEALAWAEDLTFAGHSDWRLPNAKELQSLVDYSRSPDTTRSAAIDPVFRTTLIKNEGGTTDCAFYWTGTTHERIRDAGAAVYIAFGRALGFMSNRRTNSRTKTLMDVHGAGAQRSDPKSGDPDKFAQGRGPQGDVVRIYNMVRCVRDAD